MNHAEACPQHRIKPFFLISNHESHDFGENWNIFLSDLIDGPYVVDHHSQITTQKNLFSDNTLINFHFFPFRKVETWTENNDLKSWKGKNNYIYYCSALKAFNSQTIFLLRTISNEFVVKS